MSRRVVLIGPGRLGQAVGKLLVDAGYELRALVSRDPGRAVAAARFAGCRKAATTDLSKAREGDLVLLALPDDHLEEMAAALRREGHLHPDAILVHFSGIHPAAILLQGDKPPRQALSIHPLQSFADSVMGVRNLPGSPFAVEGAEELLPLAEKLVEDLGGTPFRIAGDQKALYHAAACVASNYLVTLTAAAGQILAACGFGQDEAVRLLSPLLRGTGKNLAALGPEAALTGPIARGDVQTVTRHGQAIAALPPDLREIYSVMGRKTVELAKRKGTLDEATGKEILEILSTIERG
ncbi:MAG: DUF2520 domain-containing protein [Desulfuromonas sp.]|uniref:Rossmann-like and DUF2520 domain-containing protein n=1 Tax=Desulfuromonas sp. TaxID=892 RepID=UPI000CB48F59|nr:Rossmann-like and DUF2520 domain-containing protein [Desulfuromonas sp.]PLX86329.1 MAG: DUF2520 domain-containing protein [Desulfuromonas sp.]